MAIKTYRAKSFRINIVNVADINPIFTTGDKEIQEIIEGTNWFKADVIDIVPTPKGAKIMKSAEADDAAVDLTSLHISTLRKMATDAGHDIPKKGINKKALIELLEG